MKRFTSLVAAVLVLAIGLSTTRAADYYWDINGTNTGATDDANGVASGAVTGTNWTTDPTGLSATVAFPGTLNRAVFSAGTNANASTALNGMTTDISGNLGTTGTTGVPALNGILVEEGEINVLGTLTVNGTATVANQPVIEVKGGATLTQPGVDVVSSGHGTATGALFSYKLDGTTAALKNTNTGFAGSFVSTSSTITLNGGGTLYYGGPQINIIQTTTVISGTGNLVKDGGDLSNGVLAIASAATYTGDTIINAGELRIRTTANRLPIATNVTINANGVFNLNSVAQQVGSVSGAGAVGLGSATLTINGTVNATLDGPLGDTHNTGAGPTTAILGSLTKAGTNVQTFNGVNDLTGKVTLTSGGITVGASGSLCSDVADVVVNGGNMILNESAETIENLSGTGGTIALNSTILQTNPSDATTSNTSYTGTISGTGGLTKTNYVWESSAGSSLRINLSSTPNGEYRTLTLTGANTYSGGTHVVAGGVRANNTTGSGLGTGTVTIDTAGKVDGSGTVTAPFTVNAGGHLGGGIGTANGTSLTASGAITVNAGGNIDALLGATAVTTGDYNGDLVVDGGDYVTWKKNPGAFGGDPAGYNTWKANYGNVYTGIGTSDRVNSTGGVTLAAGSLLTIAGTGTTAPSGTYDVLDYSSHTGTLAGMYINNATGMELTSVTDNTVAKRFEAVVSSTAQVRSWAAGGDGNWSANPAEAGNWSGGSGGQPNGPGATVTFGGGGPKTVTITDSDKVVGTMNLGDGYTIAASGANQLMTNTYSGTPTINVTGNPTISAGFSPLKNTTISVANGADNLTMSGFISNGAGITKAGPGSVTVTGEIGSTGTVTVSGGTLNLMSNSIGSGAYTIAAGATLNALNSADGTGRSATGASAITNSGTLNIGDATHTGARIRGTITTASGGITNVTGGSLAIQALLNTTTTQSGGKLTGTGWMGGASFNGGSTLEPGGIGVVGTLNANGTVSFNPATASAGIITMRVDCDGTGCDLLNITNNAANTLALPTVAGDSLVVNVNALAGMADGTYSIINYNAGATATASGTMAAVSVTGTAGHTYSLALDTTNKLLNLTITTPGSGSSLSGGAVPEPSSMMLLIAGLVATAARRRRRTA
jgi:fibronectin-binding autotransporter adhesin